MPPKVILYEGRNKEVGVIIALPIPEGQRNACLRTRFLQKTGFELTSKKRVVRSLVHKELREPRAILDESATVVGSPGRTIRTKIPRQGLFAPGAIHRGCDRSESRHGRKPAGVFQCDRDCAVASHRMPHNALTAHVSRKLRSHKCRQLA